MILSNGIWELNEDMTFDRLNGHKTNWVNCPYCGMKIMEEVKE